MTDDVQVCRFPIVVRQDLALTTFPINFVEVVLLNI
jgi:hypothetical protein